MHLIASDNMVYELHRTARGVEEPELLLIVAKYFQLPARDWERKRVVLAVP